MATRWFLISSCLFVSSHCGIMLDFDNQLPSFLARGSTVSTIAQPLPTFFPAFDSFSTVTSNIASSHFDRSSNTGVYAYLNWHSNIQLMILSVLMTLAFVFITYLGCKYLPGIKRCKRLPKPPQRSHVSPPPQRSHASPPPTTANNSGNSSNSLFSIADVSTGTSTVTVRKTSSSVV